MLATLRAYHDKDIITDKSLIEAMGIIFFVMATTLGAYVRIPLIGTPVPITLQTFFVIMAGAVMGSRLGALSQLCYISLSIPYLSGPTGGYFIGFAAASYAIGRLTAFNRSGIWWNIFSFAVGSIIIYAFGAAWLSLLFRVDIAKAIYMGALPFIPGDIVKILVAAIIYSKISGRSKEIFSK
jgi:biotin transport system substrate-specific component